MGERAKRPSGAQLNAAVFRRLRKFDKLNLLERFAMFMGKAQYVELAMKRLLIDRYGCDFDAVEKFSLGRTVRELKARGFRPDFIVFLEELVDHRNYIAHELLANDVIMQGLPAGRRYARRRSFESLDRGLYEVEATLVVYDFLAKNDQL